MRSWGLGAGSGVARMEEGSNGGPLRVASICPLVEISFSILTSRAA